MMNPEILRYARVPPELPSPWRATPVFHVGGLMHVGFAPGRDLLLVVGMNGSGLFDTANGKRIARDDGLSVTPEQAQSLTAPGFDILEGELIAMAGIWGGGLKRNTPDGCYLSRQAPNWPAERVILETPDGSRSGLGCSRTLAADDLICELQAYGFSDTGRSFVIATSCDLRIFMRDASEA